MKYNVTFQASAAGFFIRVLELVLVSLLWLFWCSFLFGFFLLVFGFVCVLVI